MRLAELKVEELPPELARLPEAERVAYLEGKAARRAALQREVNQLARKRQAFVDETTREQVARKGIRYAAPPATP